MFRVPFLIAVALVVAFGGGIWSTLKALDATTGFGAIKLGPWEAFPRAQTAEADPYAKSHRANAGKLLYASAEGLTFTASTDDRGQRLNSACRYTVSGQTPAARLWTLYASGDDGQPPAADSALPRALNSRTIIRPADGSLEIAVSAGAQPGNWLAVPTGASPSGRPFLLTLTLLDTPAAGSSGLLDLSMPKIDARGAAMAELHDKPHGGAARETGLLARILPESLRVRFSAAFGHHGRKRFGERSTGLVLFLRSLKRRPSAAHVGHSGRSERGRLLLGLAYAVLTGLIGAAILHLVIILSLPQFSDRDAFTRVLAEGEINQFHRLGAVPDAAGLSKDDPFLDVAVCGFDLSESPIRLSGANPGVPFWSLGIFDGRSDEVFSINDRTSADRSLDVVIGTPQQLTQLRKALPEGLSQSILVESADTDGFVVLRAMAPRPSVEPFVSDFLDKASCAPFEWRGRKGF